MTLTQLKALFKRECSDSTISDTNLVSALNIAHLKVIKDGELLKGTDTITSVALTQEYDRPTKLLDIDRQGGVRYEGERLTYVTIDELDGSADDYTAGDGGTPTHYYLVGEKIGLYPKPDTAGKTVKVHGTRKPINPETLTNDSDETFDEYAYLQIDCDKLIVFLVVIQEKRGLGFLNQAREYEGLYYSKLREAINRLRPKDEETRTFKNDPFLMKKKLSR